MTDDPTWKATIHFPSYHDRPRKVKLRMTDFERNLFLKALEKAERRPLDSAIYDLPTGKDRSVTMTFKLRDVHRVIWKKL